MALLRRSRKWRRAGLLNQEDPTPPDPWRNCNVDMARPYYICPIRDESGGNVRGSRRDESRRDRAPETPERLSRRFLRLDRGAPYLIRLSRPPRALSRAPRSGLKIAMRGRGRGRSRVVNSNSDELPIGARNGSPRPPRARRRPRRHWPLKATSVRAHDFRIARFGFGGQSWGRSCFTAPYFGALSQPREARRISPILRRRALPIRPGRARLPILAKGVRKMRRPSPI